MTLVYEIRSLCEHELPAWFDHLATVFSKTGREHFMNHWYQDPWADQAGIAVAMAGDEIASTVRTFKRTVYMGGAQVKMGGIGEVSTKEAYRKQGLSGLLLQSALEEMAADEVGLSILFTGNTAHYARYGWEVVPTVRWRYASISGPLPGAMEVKVRPIDYAHDVERVAALYDQSSAALAGPLVRSVAYWWNWLRPQMGQALVAEKDGVILAYLLSRVREGQLQVVEFGVQPQATGALIALLNGLVAPAQDAPTSLVLPAALKQVLADALHGMPAPERVEQKIMCRVVNPVALAQQMQPVWEARLQAAGWQGAVLLDTGVGSCRLQMSSAGLIVGAAEQGQMAETPAAVFSNAEFINLLYGVGDATVVGQCATQTVRDAVIALFPQVIHTWWAADGF